MHFSIRTVRPFLLAAGLSWAACAAAQAPADIGTKLAELGGASHALGAKCGHYSAAELEQLKQQQRAQHQAGGFDMAGFDAAFDKAHSEAEASWENASAAKRRETCDKIASGGQMPSLGG